MTANREPTPRGPTRGVVVNSVPAKSWHGVRPLLLSGALAGVLAALATTLVAAVARAVDVPLEIDGEAIPIAGFAQLTVLGTVIGVGLAVTLGQRTRFLIATLSLTVLSLIPSVTLPGDLATKVVLVAGHLVGAAVVVPLLARHLPRP